MLALIQRVSEACVRVDGQPIGQIDSGLLVFLGVEKNDDEEKAQRLLKKLLAYRVFADHDQKMNLNLQQVQGGLLVVSQFTLAADTRKGLRPSFSSAAPPDIGLQLYDYFVTQARDLHPIVETGEFGADMKISLINDGPVTFMLSS